MTYQVDAEIFTERIRRYEPQIGDIVYSREGGRLGNAARIIDAEKVCLGQRMMLFKTNEETHSEFLWALLESVPFKAKLQGLVGGGAAPRVNIKDLTKISVIKPPQVLQGNFADVVQKMDRARSLYRLSIMELELLFAVVSQQAFQGGLDLSRVIPLETTPESGHEEKATEQFNGNNNDSAFELPTPADPKHLATTNVRKTILEQWLNAYAQQLGKQSLTVDVFMNLAGQKLSDLQSADNASVDDYEFSAADYDHVKDWIFENLQGKSDVASGSFAGDQEGR
jgi:type I restriction enzyme S subunit